MSRCLDLSVFGSPKKKIGYSVCYFLFIQHILATMDRYVETKRPKQNQFMFLLLVNYSGLKTHSCGNEAQLHDCQSLLLVFGRESRPTSVYSLPPRRGKLQDYT